MYTLRAGAAADFAAVATAASSEGKEGEAVPGHLTQ